MRLFKREREKKGRNEKEESKEDDGMKRRYERIHTGWKMI